MIKIQTILLIALLPIEAVAAPSMPANVAIERGLVFKHVQRSKEIRGLHDATGSGACALDADNDGWMDLFLVNGQGHAREYGRDSWWNKKTGHRLFMNERDGYFADAPERLHNIPLHNGMGCHAADLDNDNDTDLIISGFEKSYLLINEEGHFKYKPLLNEAAWITGITVADFDNNRTADIYLTGYLDYDHTAKLLETQSGFKTALTPAFKAENFNGQRNYLFLNNGDTVFTEKAIQYGAEQIETRSLFVSADDINQDNLPDLIISNDKGSHSTVLMNKGGKRFIENRALLPVPKNARSLQTLKAGSSYWFNTQTGDLPVLLKQYNNNISDRIWRSTSGHNLLANSSTFASALIDYNHNGRQDIILANGSTIKDPDAHKRTIGQANMLLLNDKGKFSEPVNFQSVHSSRSVVTLDIDNDGDMDMLFTNNNDIPELYITPGQPEKWAGLYLGGQIHRTYRVDFITSSKTYSRPIQAGTFLASHAPQITQAIGTNDQLLSIKIYQYGSSPIVINNFQVNRYLDITGKAIKAAKSLNRQRLPPYQARWMLIANELAATDALRSFTQWQADEQLKFLEDIAKYDNQQKMAGIILFSARSNNIALVEKSLEIMKAWENELTFSSLVSLLSHQQERIQCKAAEAFKHFYIEEEALTESKKLAVPLLIAELDYAPKVCFIDALAYSRDYRAVISLKALLDKKQPASITYAALFALGELRHREAIPVLKHFTQSRNSGVSETASLAIQRIEGKLAAEAIVPSDRQKPACQPDMTLQKAIGPCSVMQLRHRFKAENLAGKALLQELLALDTEHQKSAELLVSELKSNAVLMLLSIAQKNSNSSHQLAAMHTLQYMPLQTAHIKIVKAIYNNAGTHELRIAAGDVLAHHDPTWLLEKTAEADNGKNNY